MDATTGIITTIAGNGQILDFSGDEGPAIETGLGAPQNVVFDSNGNLFIVTSASSDGRTRVRAIRRPGINSTGSFRSVIPLHGVTKLGYANGGDGQPQSVGFIGPLVSPRNS